MQNSESNGENKKLTLEDLKRRHGELKAQRIDSLLSDEDEPEALPDANANGATPDTLQRPPIPDYSQKEAPIARQTQPLWLKRGIEEQNQQYYARKGKEPLPVSYPISKPERVSRPSVTEKVELPIETAAVIIAPSKTFYAEKPEALYDANIPQKHRAGLYFDACCNVKQLSNKVIAEELGVAESEVNNWRTHVAPIPQPHEQKLSNLLFATEDMARRSFFPVVCEASRKAFGEKPQHNGSHTAEVLGEREGGSPKGPTRA